MRSTSSLLTGALAGLFFLSSTQVQAAQTTLEAAQPAVQEERERTPPDPKDLPDKRDEVASLLEQLENHAKKRGAEDEACEPILEELVVEFAKSGPKDRKKIIKEVADLLTIKRKDLSKDIPDERLATFAAVMLGRLGEGAGPILAKHVGHKRLETRLKAHRAVVLSLGATKWEDGIKVLIKALDEDRPEVRAAAAEGLANFVDLDDKARKNIVSELIKVIVPIEEQLDQNQQNQGNADFEQLQRDFNILRAPIRGTLEAMTSTTNGSFRDWNAWWNDNKHRDWDKDRS